MPVYKYVTSQRIDSIESGRLRFTQAAALNDPFEANPCFELLKKSFEDRGSNIIDGLKGREPEYRLIAAQIRTPLMVQKRLTDFQHELAADWPMLSLTRNRNNLLMWSHYAESHQGFVIGFDGNHEFFQRTGQRDISSLMEVTYAQKRPLVPRFEEIPANLHEIVFLTKSVHWAYEEELRMFAKPRIANWTGEDDRGYAMYLYDVPREAFVEIIFGYRMSNELKKRVATLGRERYPNLKIFEARLHQTDFDLDIQPYQ